MLPHVATIPAELERLREQGEDAPWPREEVDRLIAASAASLDALRGLTRGVFPAQLARRGLVPALATHLELTGAGHALTAEDDVVGRRFPGEVESVAYFCTVETVRAMEGRCRVTVAASAGTLAVTVEGTASTAFAAATEHLVDRAEAVGGRLLREQHGARTWVGVELPLGSGLLAEPDGPQLVGAEG